MIQYDDVRPEPIKTQDRVRGYPTGTEWQILLTEIDELLKEIKGG